MNWIASILWPAFLFGLTCIASESQALPSESEFDSAEIVSIPDSILPRAPRSETLLLSTGCHFKVADRETIDRLLSLIWSNKGADRAIGDRQFDHGLAIMFTGKSGKEKRYFFERLTIDGQLWGKTYESTVSAILYSVYTPEIRAWLMSQIKAGKFRRLSTADLAECNFN